VAYLWPIYYRGRTAKAVSAIAKRFADEGARVYVLGRRKDELEAAAKDIGPNAIPVPADVSRAADLDRAIEVIRGDGRRLDVVVANVGLGDGATLTDVTEEQFDHVFGVNTKGSLLTVQKSLPLLAESASVILLESTTIHQGVNRMGVYAASKAAVRSLGRTWAAELAAFLAGPENSFITGAEHFVDGGQVQV
jgi:NAD(P)-dependent dehydrogenase (short-subunit alcohol dehydrogenase family)